ncbi:enoyl-CoA hydratase/isomerase family protein [Jatrophihabitans fulvus]
MNGPSVLRADAGGVTTLTLNRPHKRNALDVDTFAALERHLDDLAAGVEETGVVVLRGAGRCFSAGADISGPTRPPRRHFQADVVERLAVLPQPVVAAVHGACFTGGLELALAADLIVAAESAVFCDSHAEFALVAGWGMTQRLPRRVGAYRARDITFTGRRVTGREAADIGLADRCVPDADLDGEVDALAGAIAAGSWFSHREHKKLLLATDGMRLADGLSYEIHRVPNRVGPDFRQRVGDRFGLAAPSAPQGGTG